MGKKKNKKEKLSNSVVGESIDAHSNVSTDENLTTAEHAAEIIANDIVIAETIMAASTEEFPLDESVALSNETFAQVAIEQSAEGDNSSGLLVTDRQQIEQALEAIIFAAPKAMTLIRLRNLLNHFNYDSAQLPSVLESMMEASKNRGFQLVKVAGGYQYRSHPEHAELLQKLLEDKPAKLSSSALEVLSIIAYKQPVTRGDIDSVRGVDSGHLLKGLLEKDLVRTLGHAETVGRPLLYGTTSKFLEVFTLSSLDELPQMDELSRELVSNAENAGLNSDDPLALAADTVFGIDSGGLAANPDRGIFDQSAEEIVEHADFGLEDRAFEEVEGTPPNEAGNDL